EAVFASTYITGSKRLLDLRGRPNWRADGESRRGCIANEPLARLEGVETEAPVRPRPDIGQHPSTRPVGRREQRTEAALVAQRKQRRLEERADEVVLID